MNANIKKLLLTTFMALSAVWLSSAQITYKKTVRTEGEDVSITELAVNKEPYENIEKTRILAKNGVEFAITFPDSYQNLSIVRNNTNIVIEGRKIKVKEPGITVFGYTYTENGVSYICDFSGDVNYYGELEYQIGVSGSQKSIKTGETLVIDDNTDLSQSILLAPAFGDTWWGEWKENLDDFNEFSTAKTVGLQEVLNNVSKQGNKYKLQVWFMDGTSNALANGDPGGRSSTWIWIQDNRTPPTYELNLTQEGSGTISVSPLKSRFKAGESVVLTAQAAQGWQFSHWEENGQHIGTANPLTFTMEAQHRTIKAVFARIPKYTVTLQIVDTKGGILARSQQQRVQSGGSTTFQVPNLPNTNFKGWYRNGQLVGTENTYSLSNITQDETIQAVFEIPVQTVALSFTELSLKVGERGELPTATVTPDNASDKSISWASDNEAVAKIEDGSVVGVRSGTTQLIASSVNGKTAALQVVVSEVQKYTITLQIVDTKGGILARSQQQRVQSGGSTTFQVPNLPNTNFKGWYRNGQLVGTDNTYSLSNITQDETIQAVFEIPVQTVALSFTELSLKVGERGELPTATVTPNNASDKSISWASDNEAVAKIEDGSVVGVSSGTTQLIASSVNGKTAALQVVVSEVQKYTITLQIVDTKGTILARSQQQRVQSGGNISFQVPNLPNTNFKGWYRNGQLVGTGNTYSLSNITQDETIQAVFEIPVQTVALSFTELSLKVGERGELPTATVTPDNASDKSISWASDNEAVAKIEDGSVVGVRSGTTQLIASSVNGKTAALQVVVSEVQKYTITLQIVDTKGGILARSQQQRVQSGGSTTFQVPNLPNTNFKGWYHNGQLVGTGNTYSLSNITQDETIQAVFEIPVQTVALSFTELSLKVGERGELPTATVTPNNASDKSIRWASDNEAVAKIEDGSVVGVRSGTTQLIASSVNGKTATLQVVVSEVQQPQQPQEPQQPQQPQVVPVQSVTVTPASITAKVGDAPVQLTATVLPANATSPTVSWQSANEQVVKVDSNGKVTIIAAGETTIEAKAGEKTFTVQVKVATAPPVTPPAEEFPPYIKDFPTEITQGTAINIGQWEFLGNIDPLQIRYHFTDANGKVLAVAPATLQANSLTFTQSGNFVLVATLPANTAGWTEVRFSITVKIKN